MSHSYEFQAGQSPVLVSVPHAGTGLPEDIRARLTPAAAELPDTDWFVDRLWSGANESGAGLLVANYSRYVVDLNRPPDDAPLYATATTSLVPLTDFTGASLYRDGCEPTADEIDARRSRFWMPYHQALQSELDRLRAQHGFAVLLDAHSIASVVPWLFEGELPHLNLGSFSGQSAEPSLVEGAMEVLRGAADLDVVLDGRFKGGFTTRHYGRPDDGIHAIQLEVAQRSYMQESPPAWDERLADAFRPLVAALLGSLRDWSPAS